MKWQLSEEQESYRDTLAEWLGDVAPADRVRRWYDSADASEFTGLLVRDGWAGVGTPEELGGQGGGLVELALTAERFGHTAVPSAAWLTDVLAAPLLAGSAQLAGASFSGEHVALLVPAESVPEAGASLGLAEDGTVSGQVLRVLGAPEAARFIALAGPGDGTSGLRILSAEAATVRARDLLDRSRSVGDVRLDGSSSEPLKGDAALLLEEVARRSAVLVAADALGAMQRMLDLAVEYSLQRKQFGVPIGSFQAVKHAAATMLVDIEAARSAVYFAAASVDAGDPQAGLHAAAVKAQVTAAGARAADSALTLHGAIGYTWEHDLHFFYKRVRLDEALFGSPFAWNERIADRLALTTV